MNKIEEALERAKQQQAPAERPSEELRIEYTQTRVVRADPRRLLREHVVAVLRSGEAYERYRMLRTEILRRAEPQGWNAILVASPLEGDGRTTTALNLAITFANELNRTVLLVEADLRRPRLARILGIDSGPGLADHLLDRAPLPGLLVNPGIERLVVLPAGRPLPNATELLGSPGMWSLMREIKERYPDRYVFLDSPPLLTCADGLVLAQQVDAVLLVARVGRTTVDQLREARQRLSGRHILGVVLNGAEA